MSDKIFSDTIVFRIDQYWVELPDGVEIGNVDQLYDGTWVAEHDHGRTKAGFASHLLAGDWLLECHNALEREINEKSAAVTEKTKMPQYAKRNLEMALGRLRVKLWNVMQSIDQSIIGLEDPGTVLREIESATEWDAYTDVYAAYWTPDD